ncbi:MAG TPA: Nif3-like dinuclear metal center hexameric protein [Phycisphaerales bacterium]|nr:Nif3-like dinuclear metal center hexameric protein [Phycisphaerales bacterium]
MLVRDLAALMEAIAPLSYAEPWDKVGLLAGDGSRSLRGPVVLTIDLSEAVLDEARSVGAGAIVAYHPPIFEPLSRVTDATPRQRVVLRALESSIAIYSPHTALDAIPGGVTDWLCEGISGSHTPGKIAGDCRALVPHKHQEAGQQVRIVTYVPAEDLDRVRKALATAGAGRIGNYQLCSFSAEGTGTFFGGEGTKPTVGEPGRIESVREHRLEMSCSRGGLALALDTLRKFHPYEEPAIDVYDLVAQPRRGAGSGRRLVLDKPATVRQLAERIKGWVKRDRVRYAVAHEHKEKEVSHVGAVPGSGESLSKTARAEGCEVFVTGEMKHHEVLGALNAGMSVILGGHTNTERGYLPRLKEKMLRREPGLQVLVSTVDVDPLETV